jgi:hypothetical protein
MAKKPKYEAPEAPVQAPQEPAPFVTAEEVNQPKSNGSPIQAKPQVYLEDELGTQYQFTRFPMPKRASKNEPEFNVYIDDVQTPVWTTASRGWAADDAVIEYIWLRLADGTTGYITLGYGEDAKKFNDVIFKRGEGKANRPNPVRVPKDPVKEENRKAQALATLAKKKAEQPAETPQEETPQE